LIVANFNLPHLHLAPPLKVTVFEFCHDIQRKKIRVPGLSYGIVCVILHLAVSVGHRLVTDRHTTMAYTTLVWLYMSWAFIIYNAYL